MLVPKRNFKRGFTLVELLVTISIFAILTGVVLFNQQKFNSTILLTNLAYDTALTIRQAQTYGVNIKEFDSGGGSQFVPYGVHFDISETNKSFILFADINNENKYSESLTTCNMQDGCVNRYDIKRGNYIFDIKVTNNGVESSVSKLDIIFKRPNPDAIINSKGDSEYKNCVKVEIFLRGADGSQRTVVVQSNGLIEIVN